jgi:hypothetical protein
MTALNFSLKTGGKEESRGKPSETTHVRAMRTGCITQPRQGGSIISKNSENMTTNGIRAPTRQDDHEPQIYDDCDKFQDINVGTRCVHHWLTGAVIQVLHVKSSVREVGSTQSPFELGVRAPTPYTFVGSIRDEVSRRLALNQIANV